LYDLLAARVSESDLKTIVFLLGLYYESLPGATLGEKMLSLIQYCEDRNRYNDLLEAIDQVRPDLRVVSSSTAAAPATPVSPPHQGTAPSPASAAAPLFVVVLAHSSKDKPPVECLADLLKARGIHPWLDKEQIAPGRWFQDVIQAAIPTVKAAAIVIGPGGLGRWQALEIRTFVSRCVEEGMPVIPVLLPGVEALPDTLPFLKELQLVKFHKTLDESSTLAHLVWGISGTPPQ
jgi:hypothetical protein